MSGECWLLTGAKVTNIEPVTVRMIEGAMLVLICMMTLIGTWFFWVTTLRRNQRTTAGRPLLGLSTADLLECAVNVTVTSYAISDGR